jgi:hypothetical protein
MHKKHPTPQAIALGDDFVIVTIEFLHPGHSKLVGFGPI